RGPEVEIANPRTPGWLRPRRQRPRDRRAAEYSQQFPPSDGDCHTPLPCEVRKGNDTTPRACSLHVQGRQDAGSKSGKAHFSALPPKADFDLRVNESTP